MFGKVEDTSRLGPVSQFNALFWAIAGSLVVYMFTLRIVEYT